MNYVPSVLPSDSVRYDILYEAAKSIKGVPGVTMEIGLRRGGGTEAIIQGSLDADDKRVHMALDPYGHLPYATGTVCVHQYDYTNQMRMEALPLVYEWCEIKDVTFVFWPMTDLEFFRAFPDGPPFYNEQEERVTDFALVHYDGPHSTQSVLDEVNYFRRFSPIGAVWIFDDVSMYTHYQDVEPVVFETGFERVTDAANFHRAWYTKVR